MCFISYINYRCIRIVIQTQHHLKKQIPKQLIINFNRKSLYTYWQMRSQQQTRRIQNSVMKSPSPDIANRNIIKDTVPPIEDVKRYLEKSGQSRSPRLSDVSQSGKFQNGNGNGSQIDRLKQRILELEFRVNQLTMQNEKLKRSAEEKAVLQGELMRMRETMRSYEGSQVATPKSQDKTGRTLEQMQERLMKLIGENNRLGALLQDKDGYNQMLLSQNKRLKTEIQFAKYQAQPSVQTSAMSQFAVQQPSQDLSVVRNYYQGRIEPEMRRSETEWLNRIRELTQRMNKIQQNQQYIQNQVSRRSTIVTPIKNDNKSPFSNKKTDDANDSSGIQLPQSVRPFEGMTMRSTTKDQDYGRQYEDTIRELENRNRTAERENETYRKRIIELESQLRKAREITTFDVRQNADNDQFTRKIRELEQEIDSKSFTLSNMERDLRSTKQDFARLKERSDRQLYLLENQRNTCKKAFEQQRSKSLQLQDTIQKQNQRIFQLESKLKQKQLQFDQLKLQLKSQTQYKESNLKQYYQQILRNKDRAIGEELHKYLQQLGAIRREIEASGVDEVIGESQRVVNERVGVEKQILAIRDENQRIIGELKARLIQQQQRIIQLQKDNQLLKSQIRELEGQKQKLKKAMYEFDGIKLVSLNPTTMTTTTTNINTMTSMSTIYKNQSGCRLKNCLKETIKKIDTLEYQITEILRE